jgi:hypothetical protein
MKKCLRKGSRKVAAGIHFIYVHVFKRPHNYLLQHSTLYHRWHSYRFHKHIHIVLGTLASLAIVFVIVGLISHNAFALSTWVQSDWSGGIGSFTTNQYSSASNVTTSTSNQVTLNQTNNWGSLYSSWKYRQTITFNNTSANLGVTPDTLINFPVLVELTSSNFNFSHAQSAGQDIRFSASDGNTPLNYQIESWNSTTDKAYIWVNVPEIDADTSTNNIYMYYGKSSATDAQNKTGVWNSGYAGVWHLNEASGNNSDSTINNNTGGVLGNPTRLTTGVFGNAMDYVNSNDMDSITNISVSNVSYAIEGWFYYPLVASPSGWRTLTRGNNDHQLLLNSSNQLGSYDNAGGRAWIYSGYTIASLTTGWHYIAVVGNNTNNTSAFYIDGLQVGTINWKSNDSISYFGNYQGAGQEWGSLDEFRISTTLRDSGWIAASYKSESNNLASFNSEQTQYPTSGSLTSNIYDTGVGENWGNLSYSATVPTNSTVSVLVRAGNQSNLSDALAFTSCSAIASGNAITSTCAPNNKRYVQYQLQFTSDGSVTPTFNSITIQYSPTDTLPPSTNVSNIAAFDGNGGASIAGDGWANVDPYFTWTAATDHSGGSGILGYCLYLGQDPTGNPVTTEGLLGTSPLSTNGACQFAISTNSIDTSLTGYLNTALTSSNTPYYLNILAITGADFVWTGSPAQFEFTYDRVSPTNPAFISAPSEFVSNKQVTLTWPTTGADAASDDNSGVAGLQYRIGANGTWYGANHNGNQDMTDLLSNNGSYTTVSNPDFANLVQGNNIIYFRTWDNAGNVSPAYVTTVVKINTTAPSTPQNLTATPTTNTTNSFAFSWLAPASFTGSVSNITYCYTVNVIPNANNCTYTAAGQTSLDAGAYATEPGDNTFYVVAKDEAGNINYATAASTTFTANTPAPGIPLNLDIADISIKATSSWKLALSWNQPSTVGAGIATYKIYRSTNGTDFTDIASTAGTSYVDTSLNQEIYYYKIDACDSANNCGGFTSIVNLLPTGKFTSPANLLDGPTATVSTRTATINWITDRDSDSSVEYGLSTNVYFNNDVANTTQTISHSITLNNLNAGTTYYYRAQWTDVDGNIGTSTEGSFTTLPAPKVNNVTVTDINLYTATVNFSSIGATAVQLVYGANGITSNSQNLNTSTAASSYSIPLSNFNPGTTYTFTLNPTDLDGNLYNSISGYTFSTPPQPVITNVTFQPVPGALTGTEQMFWTTNVPCTSQISYGLVNGARQYQLDTTLATNHSMTISNLTYSTQYSVTATSVDDLGNIANSDLQIFKSGIDTRPPVVSNLNIQPSIIGTGSSAQGQLVISWKTDKAGTSQIAYGQGSGGSYSSKTAEDTALVTNHVVVVSDLSTSEVYHLQAISSDANGVTGYSADQTTIIGQSSDNALSIVFNALQSIFGL